MITKSGNVLTTLDAWETHAGPKRSVHWQDGRSAKELARAWLNAVPEFPAEIRTVLESRVGIGPIKRWSAEPEARIPFDDFGGEPANLDVLLIAHDAHGPVIIGIEAKADEPFGLSVRDTLRAAKARLAENPRSKGITRLEQLICGIFGSEPGDVDAYAHVRYQLLTATAATLCAAERQGATRAVLLVHEFITDRTSDKNHAVNRADLDAFLRLVAAGDAVTIAPGALLGPFHLPGKPLIGSDIEFFVGKAVRDLRGQGA